MAERRPSRAGSEIEEGTTPPADGVVQIGAVDGKLHAHGLWSLGEMGHWSMEGAEDEAILARRVRVVLPGWLVERLPGSEISVPVGGYRRAAQVLRIVVPAALMVVGAVLAVAGAILAERPELEAEGTLGTELGAALLFAGAVLWTASRVPTLGRVIALVVAAVAGVAACAAALLFGWSGAALTLAMELGVAAVVLLVIDVVLIGLVFPRVEGLATGPDRAEITLHIGSRRPVD